MVPVCDRRYHIYYRFRHFGAEIKKLWNYPLEISVMYIHVAHEQDFSATAHSLDLENSTTFGMM